jgi:hypothetical protein
MPVGSSFFSTRSRAFKFGLVRVKRDPPTQYEQNKWNQWVEVYDLHHHPYSPDEDAVNRHVKEFQNQMSLC